MADVNYTLKADIRRNAASAVPGKGEGPNLKYLVATRSVTARALNNTMKLVRLPSNARISGLSKVSFDDLAAEGAPTLDIGVAPVDDSANKVTADPDALNDGIALSTAGTVALIKDHANYGKQLWQYVAGLTEDPSCLMDIYVTFADAVTDTTGDITAEVLFTVD